MGEKDPLRTSQSWQGVLDGGKATEPVSQERHSIEPQPDLRGLGGHMSDPATLSFNQSRMVDIQHLSDVTGLSKPTLWRHHEAGLIPAGCKIGRAVRWRLRTGDPKTGLLDWLEAGCPTVRCNSPASETED